MANRIRRRRASSEETIPLENESKQRTYIIVGAVGLGVVLLLGLLFLNLNSQLKPAGSIEDMVDYGAMTQGHDDNVSYEGVDLPPAGGVHHNAWQNCGIYYEPILSKYAIHSLEHGTVWITYQPTLAESEVNTLRDYARGQQQMLVSPFPDQRSPIVLTSWGYQLELKDANDSRIAEFITRNKNRRGRAPEPGASCANGVGTPDEV